MKAKPERGTGQRRSPGIRTELRILKRLQNRNLKKKNSLERKKEKKDKKDEKIEELTDRLTRQMAEFDNYRKRTDKEKASMYMIGAKDVIEKLLPVVDNFERGLAGADLEDPFADGRN